jgi:hypothetical protein
MSLAQLLLPITSTRHFAAICRRQTASQHVARAKTETAITASVETDSLTPGRGIQRVRAEMTTSPVNVPTLVGTAGPRVKGTAPNALRIARNHTAETIEATKRLAATDEIRLAAST